MKRVELPVVLGTAGHIDHGKTTLVRALTGVDCDRLAEEKKRGITIELGFAPLELPDGRTISIVDVPGHEKFIRQMVAGAAGIDAVLLVVAADEGVMPQTREHLEILDLLGIGTGLVALTKVDRVDEELLELAVDDVRNLLSGTFLEKAPIIPVSPIDGTGLDTLRKEIQKVTDSISPRSGEGGLFLPIDRAFPISGFGTVVTGTVYAGQIKVGEEIEVLPSGFKGRVRSLEVHEEGVSEAFAGQRTAVNLAGIRFKEMHRGDVLCTPSLFRSTLCVDVLLRNLRETSEPLKHWQRVRLHMGTSDILARVSFFDPGEKILPGQSGLSQLVLEEPVAATFNQGFVIRAYSPLETIGGGHVLFPYGWKPRSRVRKTAYLGMVKELAEAKNSMERLHAILQTTEIISLDEAAGLVQIPPAEMKETLSNFHSLENLVVLHSGSSWVVSGERMEKEWDQLFRSLSRFHENEPHLAGMTIEDASASFFQGEDARLGKAALVFLGENGKIVQSESRVGLSGFVPQDFSRFEAATLHILELCEKRGFEMPTLAEAMTASGLGSRDFSLLLKQLRENGKAHIVAGDLLLSQQVKEKGLELLGSLQGDITLAAFRDITGSSRKYILPLLEFMDSEGFTRRVGEKRILRAHKR